MKEYLNRLQELDRRHSELLERLSELDESITSVLSEWTKIKTETAEPANTGSVNSFSAD
jgi:prefoldin subunit 5